MASKSGDGGTMCALEFTVQMSCQSCVDAVHKTLKGAAGVQNVEVQLENQMVLVQTTLPSQELSSELCLIEGTIDGLEPGLHGLHVHQYGDLTKDCSSCGDHFNPDGASHGGPQDTDRHRGDLGNVHAEASGRATFRIEDKQLKVWDVIGRSLVVDEGEDDLGRGGHPLSKVTGNSGKRLACGIIARSAGLFQNPKQICSCDGLTIWEERGRPIAGQGRKDSAQPPAHL
ncbi:copper chaperone for superoxide dismutase, isoform CRA_d [Rattus norvegicus]|uniref:Superoxide dismutase copper chaperone n=1 Tax=Rattus norvegicus TaxID=10116 RepID=A6HYZ4_RAT|nr:copper chaperone for superoxide dismutase, isoform CRA_d [Rattus norvegicus]